MWLEELKAVLDTAHSAFVAMDEDGRITYRPAGFQVGAQADDTAALALCRTRLAHSADGPAAWRSALGAAG